MQVIGGEWYFPVKGQDGVLTYDHWEFNPPLTNPNRYNIYWRCFSSFHEEMVEKHKEDLYGAHLYVLWE